MPDDPALDAYVHAKQEVTQHLRRAQRYFQRVGEPMGEGALQQLLVRLAEDRFNLVVLGQFKRGKSSLINAIIGQELLPTAAVPLTSVVTTLRYGPTRRVQIRHQGWVLPREIAAAALADYVTERGNPGNEKRVVAAEIEVPVPFLRRGLHVVDTPGVGSVFRHNTATTYRYLPEADAAIFVTSAESPFSDAEAELLDTVRQHVRKLFFVLNKVDQLPADEQQEVQAFLQQTIAARLGVPSVRLFPLSARLALEAKREGDAGKLRASGLLAFEERLAAFLAAEQGKLLLVALLDRALRLLAEEQKRVELPGRAAEQSAEQRAQSLATLQQNWEELARERQTALARAQRRAEGFVRDSLGPALAAFAGEAREELAARAMVKLDDGQDDDLDSRYQRARRGFAEALERRSARWLRDQSGPVDEVAMQLIRELQAGLRETLDQMRQMVAAALALPIDAVPAIELPPMPELGRELLAGRFELPAPEETEAPLIPLPGRLALRLMRRHLETQLEHEVERTVAALERHVLTALTWPLERLARAADEVAGQARVQIEAALRGAAAPEPARAVDGAHGAGAADSVESLVAELTALRDRLLAWTVPQGTATDTNGTSDDSRQAALLPLAGGEDAPPDRHCHVCVRVHQAVYDFLCSWQYHLAADREAQAGFREAGGFCPKHTWQLEHVASARGLSEAYAAVLDRAVRHLRELADSHGQVDLQRLRAVLPDAPRCRACGVEREAEERSVREVVMARGGSVAAAAWGDVPVCLPHLHRLLCQGLPEPATRALLAALAGRLEAVSGALQGYALKIDARRRELLSQEEEQAAQQALVWLAGEPPLG